MMNEKYRSYVDACLQCAIVCNRGIQACLNEWDVKLLVKSIKLQRECAAFCVLSAEMTEAESEYTNQLMALCADVCLACAEECEKHADSEDCIKSARACIECAQYCESFQLELVSL